MHYVHVTLTFGGRQRVVFEAELDVVEDVVDALHALKLEGVGALLQVGRDVVHAGLQLGVARLPLTPENIIGKAILSSTSAISVAVTPLGIWKSVTLSNRLLTVSLQGDHSTCS